MEAQRMRYRNMDIAVADAPLTCHPSPEELETVGKSGFRCFCCLRRRPRSHFGGKRVTKALCDRCYPYTDDQEIAGYISFDRYHGF